MENFWTWWQHLPENINPILFEIGWFRLHYYGLMYIVAFAITYFLAIYRIKHEGRFTITANQIKCICFHMIVGLIIGARLGYVLFYGFSYYLKHPLEIILPFSLTNGFQFSGISGMSYHGGLIGVTIAAWLYVRKSRIDFLESIDLFVPVIPLGYTFGRLGNFINGELFGRTTTASIGMYFPLSVTNDLRHPSQLYEAFFEGIFLFVLLWSIRKKKMPKGAMLSIYLVGYGLVRFIIEFYREPDAHLGSILFSLSIGQVLCLFMVMSGIILSPFLWKKEQS